jgi:hypothetical protein
MGPPAAPGAHPENQQAAQWTASRGDQELPPYVITGGPAPAPRTDKEKDSPMEHILDFFNTWSRKAEELSSNIWLNCKHRSQLFLTILLLAKFVLLSEIKPW